MESMSKVIDDLISERGRQVNAEGWTPLHDDEHVFGELSRAAACYCLSAVETVTDREPLDFLNDDFLSAVWPWEHAWWKPKDARRDLVRAAALIIAEIERLDRCSARDAATEHKP
jgi:hypothetical protein